MVRISIQAAHEQTNPLDLLNDVIKMDKKGVERCWSSDHYMPWWHTGSSGGAAWPWIGAALAKTNIINNSRYRSNAADIEISSCYCCSSVCHIGFYVSE
jgi:hypothetical protein